MPKSKKPRKPRGAITGALKANSATKVKAVINPNKKRIEFQNLILSIIETVNQDLTTVDDLDELYHFALTHEALCNAGYGSTEESLYKAWDNALDAAFRRGDSGLRYGFNPSEKEAVKSMLFEFIRVLKLTPNDEFYAIENNMVDEHNKRILEQRSKI